MPAPARWTRCSACSTVHLREHGFLAMSGQIIDATVVAAPRQRNSRDDNDSIKKGETPPDWSNHPAKRQQKDAEARRTKKHGRTYCGYKNHISVDQRHKPMRRAQSSIVGAREAGQCHPLAGARPGRACGRPLGHCHRRQACAHHRAGAHEDEDRDAEPHRYYQLA